MIDPDEYTDYSIFVLFPLGNWGYLIGLEMYYFYFKNIVFRCLFSQEILG